MATEKTTNIVAKFGGTSLATGHAVGRVGEIVVTDPKIKAVVVSAPGKRWENDTKITDQLKSWYEAAQRGESTACQPRVFAQRFEAIAAVHLRDEALKLYKQEIGKSSRILDNEFHRKGNDICTLDYALSRGEYYMAMLMAQILGWEFVDAAKLIRFGESGLPHWELSYSLIVNHLDSLRAAGKTRFVIPGFYGSDINGNGTVVFTRGGSDVTGAIIAAALGWQYENWTDTDGLMTADPRIVHNVSRVHELTYREAEEAAYLGMGALHPLTLYPMIKGGLEMWVKNTHNISCPGTKIASELPPDDAHPVRLITGRSDFSFVTIEQPLMNESIGIVAEVSYLFASSGISIDHMPGGTNSLSVVIDNRKAPIDLIEKVAGIVAEKCGAKVQCEHGVALVSIIGADMKKHVGVASLVISAIAHADVNIRLINQGASEVNITIGVRADNLSKAIQAVHHACFGVHIPSFLKRKDELGVLYPG